MRQRVEEMTQSVCSNARCLFVLCFFLFTVHRETFCLLYFLLCACWPNLFKRVCFFVRVVLYAHTWRRMPKQFLFQTHSHNTLSYTRARTEMRLKRVTSREFTFLLLYVVVVATAAAVFPRNSAFAFFRSFFNG